MTCSSLVVVLVLVVELLVVLAVDVSVVDVDVVVVELDVRVPGMILWCLCWCLWRVGTLPPGPYVPLVIKTVPLILLCFT